MGGNWKGMQFLFLSMCVLNKDLFGLLAMQLVGFAQKSSLKWVGMGRPQLERFPHKSLLAMVQAEMGVLYGYIPQVGMFPCNLHSFGQQAWVYWVGLTRILQNGMEWDI